MSFTNSQLAQKMSDLIGYWTNFATEHKNWLGGVVGGGPSSDGRYPLTDWAGNESLVKAPAQLQEDVDGMVSSASASATAAAASAAAASTSETNAAASASTATTQAGLADADRVAAELAETNAANSAVTATAQANNASTSASNASTSETNAAASETAAAASAAAAAASAAAAATFDPALYGALADNEVVTGDWDFSGQIDFTGNVVWSGTTYQFLMAGNNGVRISESGEWVLFRPRTAAGTAWDSAADFGYNKSTGRWRVDTELDIEGFIYTAAKGANYDTAYNRVNTSHHSATYASTINEYNRWASNQDMDLIVEPGQYGGYSTMTNGPTGMSYDPFWVGASSSDVSSLLVVPRTASRGLAYRGETSNVVTAWHYTPWTLTAPTVDYRTEFDTGQITTPNTYLDVKRSAAGVTGIRLLDSSDVVQGYLYASGSQFGLLHSGGGWAMQIASGSTQVDFPGNVDANNGLDVSGLPLYVSTTGAAAPAAGQAALVADFLYLDGKEVIDGNDAWLRINQNGDFANGIYVLNNLRVDGSITWSDSQFSQRTIGAMDYNSSGFDYWNSHNSASVTAGTWYTIAKDPSGLDITTDPVGKTGASRTGGRFRIYDLDSGQHSFIEFQVTMHYGRRPVVTVLNRSGYGSDSSGIRAIRVIRYSTYNGHAIQVEANQAGTLYCTMQKLGVAGWTAVDFVAETPHANWVVEDFDMDAYTDFGFGVSVGAASGVDTTQSINMAVTPTGVHAAPQLWVQGDTVEPNPGALQSVLSGNYLHIDGKEVIDANDTWIRLNQNNDFSSGVYTPYDLRVDGEFFLGGGTLHLDNVSGNNNEMRLTTAHGYIEFGPKNTSWAHIYTDRAAFYFNKDLRINNRFVLSHASTSYGSGEITFSTSAPSGGASGDVWFEHEA